MAKSGDARLPAAFLSIVTGVHDLVAQLKPTGEELRALIDFLTDIGHSADARRQEWVLLADVIGVSTHVEDLNTARPDAATPNTLPGPFYRQDVPEVSHSFLPAKATRTRQPRPCNAKGTLKWPRHLSAATTT
jgi:hydroxyquinol 1,2-dioxygenase